jgi:PAS domain S-box-containing protein
MNTFEVLQRTLTRERDARRQAETLLEDKCRELYLANEELRSLASDAHEQAEHLSAILDTAAEGVLTVDGSGFVQLFNPAAERIFGYAACDVIGRSVATLISDFPLFGSARDATLHAPGRHGEQLGTRQRTTGRRSGGIEFPLELTVSRVRRHVQTIYLAILRDISESKRLETQLAHAQRMESVGQLAAGIAHELNTPIQYVGDNIRFLHDAFRDIIALLEGYQELHDASDSGLPCMELMANVSRAIEGAGADLDFLRLEIPQAIQQSLDGIGRVAKIVRAMKEFSHPGGEEMQAIDLNHAIESTIAVSRNEWKYVATMKTDFDADLPAVTCFPGDINQALLNVIVNAAHAIEAKSHGGYMERGQIAVSTRNRGSEVEIRISDTGSGIPPAVQSRVFDPFFTTKALGKGTGQGLAIAYSVIVEKHGGTIEFETEVGHGTTFIVRLPLVCKASWTAPPAHEAQRPTLCNDQGSCSGPR